MDIFEYIDRVKANFDKQPEPRYNTKKYFMGGLATPKRGLVDGPGSYGGKVFEPKIDILEDIVLNFNQGTEYKSVKDVLKEYTKRTKDPFTKKMVNKGLTKGSKASELIKPIISLLETPEDKVNRVFTEALSTDTPVDISVVDKAKVKTASRASVWRADIADKTNLDQAFVNKILNKNSNYIKNKKLFDYLGQTQLLLTDLKDLPLKDQLSYAEESLKGRPRYTGISKSGKTKIMRDPAHKVMEFALRNFNANEGKGAVTFFKADGKTPIKYKTGLKIPYRNSIISYKGKKHTVADLRKPGHMQKFFPNVYDNQIKINKILNQEVDNPFKKGKKINFGDLMTEIQVKGYGWSSRTGSMAILHGPDGVKGDPFNNLSFGTTKLNYQQEDINKLYRLNKIDNASRLKLLDAAQGKLKGLQGDDLLNAIVKQQTKVASQIQKGKTFGTTRQETKKLAQGLSKILECKLADGVNCDDPMSYYKSLKEQEQIAAKGKGPNKIKAVNKVKAAKNLLYGTIGPAALAVEAGIAAPIAGYEFFQGALPSEILSTATYGIAGKDRDEIIQEASSKEIFKPRDFIETGDLLQSLYSDPISGGYRGRYDRIGAIEDTEKKFKDQYYDPYFAHPKTGDFSESIFKLRQKQQQDEEAKYQKQREERKQERADKYTDTSSGLELFASGGIASGPPPEKGPQSQGLAYLMKNGKR